MKSDKYQYLTAKEILSSYLRQMIEQTRFAYFPLGKVFEKQAKKQVDAVKSLNLYAQLKQLESIFPQQQLNDLIIDKLKKSRNILQKQYLVR